MPGQEGTTAIVKRLAKLQGFKVCQRGRQKGSCGVDNTCLMVPQCKLPTATEMKLQFFKIIFVGFGDISCSVVSDDINLLVTCTSTAKSET